MGLCGFFVSLNYKLHGTYLISEVWIQYEWPLLMVKLDDPVVTIKILELNWSTYPLPNVPPQK